MAPAAITAAWLKGFESDDAAKGGCPACPAHGRTSICACCAHAYARARACPCVHAHAWVYACM